LVTKDQLFKGIKKFVKEDQQVLDLLDHLEQYAYTYNALFNSEDELWNGDKEIKENINALILFRVTLCHPLLMAAFDKFEIPEFKRLLSAVVSISFRYNVIGKLQTNEMEKAYNKTAVKVYNKTIGNAIFAIADLKKEVYLDDDTFRNYFELKAINTSNSQQKKIARYILYKIESRLSDGVKSDFAIDDGTIEHILPENMDEQWSAIFSEEDHIRGVYMLGNLTLLSAAENNRHAAQKSFDEKLRVYANSRFALSKQIGGSEWNLEMIKHRQKGLSKTASGIWKI
jgi:hypothetical protein